jgi:hypothetical protein
VLSAIFYEQRYAYHVQQYAENNEVTAFGLQETLVAVRQVLEGVGEIPALLASKTEALVHERLLSEATMMAYQDYFFLAAVIVVVSILPAVPWGDVYARLWQACMPLSSSATQAMNGNNPAVARRQPRPAGDAAIPVSHAAERMRYGK